MRSDKVQFDGSFPRSKSEKEQTCKAKCIRCNRYLSMVLMLVTNILLLVDLDVSINVFVYFSIPFPFNVPFAVTFVFNCVLMANLIKGKCSLSFDV